MSREGSSNKPRLCYHLDTNYLIDYLGCKDLSDRDRSRIARQVITKAINTRFLVKVSEIAAGEFVKVMAEKGDEHCLSHFRKLVRDKTIVVSPLEKRRLGRFTDLVNQMKGAEYLVGSTDVLIAAQSMADRECRGLLTFEDRLIHSMSLKNIITISVRDRKFNITDDPWR